MLPAPTLVTWVVDNAFCSPFIHGHSYYGLGRETYETHNQPSAFGLMDVHRHEKRHMDGKWEGFATRSGDMVCHRVELLTSAFA